MGVLDSYVIDNFVIDGGGYLSHTYAPASPERLLTVPNNTSGQAYNFSWAISNVPITANKAIVDLYLRQSVYRDGYTGFDNIYLTLIYGFGTQTIDIQLYDTGALFRNIYISNISQVGNTVTINFYISYFEAEWTAQGYNSYIDGIKAILLS